ncbi:hypothetical protein [Sulfurimonas sp.]|uniref:hypothetical protein n=1 Tax=Sulfurimonas sp. TaxID=2022749 RepID=UPI0019E01285|nr:hypothetical protein [Sulfurimonas sp.]MBE0515170.1 hypothetical protein [Sulfurimonas sp.]
MANISTASNEANKINVFVEFVLSDIKNKYIAKPITDDIATIVVFTTVVIAVIKNLNLNNFLNNMLKIKEEIMANPANKR